MATITTGDSDKPDMWCGTPVHMAPEVHLKKEQGRPSEIWSIGTIVYTMACRVPPFGHKRSKEETAFSVVHGNLQFPADIDPEIKAFLKFVLVKDPRKRPTVDQVLEHDFLKPIDQIATVHHILSVPPSGVDPTMRSPDTSSGSSIDFVRGIPWVPYTDPYPSFNYIRGQTAATHIHEIDEEPMPVSKPFDKSRRTPFSSMSRRLSRSRLALRPMILGSVTTPDSGLWGFDAAYGCEQFEVADVKQKGALKRMRRWLRLGIRTRERTETGALE